MRSNVWKERHRLEFGSYGELLATASTPNWRDEAGDSKRGRNLGGNFDIPFLPSRRQFTGVESWAEAYRYATEGWPEGLAKVDPIREKIGSIIQSRTTSPVPVVADEGDDFLLDRLLENDPECWESYSNEEAQEDGHLVRIGVNITIPYDVPAEAIVHRGAAIMAAVEAIASSGRSVELELCTANDNGQATFIPLKRSDEMIETDRLAFALIHPAMLRCILFSAWDSVTQADFNRYLTKTYGSPAEDVESFGKYDLMFGISGFFDGSWATPGTASDSILKRLRKLGIVE